MKTISRRNFFKTGSAVAAGLAVPGAAISAQNQSENAKIRRYKPFGKTGWNVGDISAGAGQREPALFNYVFESGINLIDTAQQYSGHEERLGAVLPKWRDKVFVIDKWSPRSITPETTKAELLESLDVSLKKLKTDYVDCMMIHSIGTPVYGDLKRIQNPAIYEAWDEAKKLGKVKYTGASSHGINMIEEIGWGVDNDKWDIILVGANFLTKGLEPVLQKARSKGIATVAMKTMTTYKLDLNIADLKNRETNARQAVIKYILASDLFDTMILGMNSFEKVNEYLAVSGTTSLNSEDEELLQLAAAEISPKYCRPGCDGCSGTCPSNVPIWDILRYKMYFENYGNEKHAMEQYAQINNIHNADACKNCTAPCEQSCPYHLPVRDRLLEAHSQLTLA